MLLPEFRSTKWPITILPLSADKSCEEFEELRSQEIFYVGRRLLTEGSLERSQKPRYSWVFLGFVVGSHGRERD
jgi:hypothetical protein